ncbi:type III secretion system outer membrane ring subunit SctC [Halomonas sp. MCCC 1A11057]|uniref:type III secretion system outer membrane ring subunit SctC n=1 Tax=Halomonas sp. MCCC 1A11057 TaxID=2733482 RepID=UPI001F16C005|nr:type III secretion system outer membrane ring subunit SctC [Halomonas sp. MCCC 1A11057]
MSAAVPASWKNTSFAYDAHDTPLAEALMDFARTFGVTLEIEGVSGAVNGRLRANSAEEYLDRLALEHHFLWFVYNGTLYVSPREAQSTVSLEVSEDAIPDLREALNQVGLLDTRFGWGELPDEGTVIVSGPRRYLDYISALSERRRKGEDKLEIMVFPLRYALADDRTINYRGQSIVVPGVATILSALLEKRASGTIPNASDVFGMAPDEGLQAFAAMREQAAQRIQRHVDNRSQTPARLSQQLRDDRSGGSMVSADIRNNALLIRDDPDKESMYRSLIERLDQPRNVIEIDAIILDVERGKLAELGINWRVGGGGMEATFNASGAEPFLARGSSATVLIQDFGHFFAQVRALESRGEATLVANPSILTIENQPAVIDFSATSFLSSIGERVASITPVTAGTSLQVIPRAIGNDSQRLVQLSLDIEDGNIEQDDGGDAGTPRVNRGTISTQAVIRADRSLVVGGFNVERSQDLSSKVPLLGDLPGVGKLFRYTSRHHSNRERLFILTPRLVGTELDPLEYVSPENRHALGAALDNQESRHRGRRNSVTRAEVERALGAFAEHHVPEGFEAFDPQEFEGFCRNGPVRLMGHERMQGYANDRFVVVIAAVRNNGEERHRFDEAACGYHNVLAVAVWPNADLLPGEQAEVMLALRRPDSSARTRPALIEPPLSQ